jgi:hypothetical protein
MRTKRAFNNTDVKSIQNSHRLVTSVSGTALPFPIVLVLAGCFRERLLECLYGVPVA